MKSTPKFIVVPSKLIYKGNALEVPAYDHKACEELAKGSEGNKGFLSYGNTQCMVCENLEDAVEVFAEEIGNFLKGWWGKWKGAKESDFEFEIAFTEIDNGRAWLIPNASYCGKYPVKFCYAKHTY